MLVANCTKTLPSASTLSPFCKPLVIATMPSCCPPMVTERCANLPGCCLDVYNRLVLVVAQHRRHGHRQNVGLRAGVNHGFHEHVLLQHALGILGDDAHRCGAGSRVNEGADVVHHAAKRARGGGVAFPPPGRRCAPRVDPDRRCAPAPRPWTRCSAGSRRWCRPE